MNPFLIITVFLVISITLEKLFPRVNLPYKKGWMTRALIFNVIQLLVVIIGGYTWEKWLNGPSLFKLPWSPFYNGLFAYLCNTWIFFWWHFVRHENIFYWRFVHQMHHAPERLETITSFYKHPIEFVLNSLIITVLTRPILGLNDDTNAWLTVFSAIAEFFYHINISTPRWLGFFIQRPESHLAHHYLDKRCTWNHGDLVLWDMLNGTFWNPTLEEEKTIRTGFSNDKERTEFWKIMKGDDVLKKKMFLPKDLIQCFFISCLFALGILNTAGLIFFNSPEMRGPAIISVASPLPFVFSAFNSVETFSTKMDMDLTMKNGTIMNIPIDHKLYAGLKGPYNRRNVIGAVFSHGPFFDKPEMIKIRDQVLDWGFCQGKLSDFGIHGKVDSAMINVKSKTLGNEGKLWQMKVVC